MSLPFNFKGVQVLGELKSVCVLLPDLKGEADLFLHGIKDQQDALLTQHIFSGTGLRGSPKAG